MTRWNWILLAQFVLSVSKIWNIMKRKICVVCKQDSEMKMTK